MELPYMQPIQQFLENQQEFMGLNRSLRADPRQWFDMENLSPRDFPVLAPREHRGVVGSLADPGGLLERDALVYVDAGTMYINQEPVSGLVLSPGPKQMVSMGAYIVIMPDKKYVNTANTADVGSIESEYTYTGDVVLTPARADGSEMTAIYSGVEPPANPTNGAYWVDMSGETHVLKQYSSMSAVWTDILSTYTRITLPGIGSFFSKLDGVEISGLDFIGTDPSLLKQIPLLNGTKIIHDITGDYIIVDGLLPLVHTLEGVTVNVKRSMPDMDFLTESENRLFGCKYGVVDGKPVNELYACALGDFKNWRKFMGVSTDSYAASVGTDGKFTGATTYQGYPIFFKEQNLHKLYGSMPSNYRVETYACRGVQEGSHDSLAIVGELLYYKGRTDVLVYDGSDPVSISDHLGQDTYRNAVAGSFKHLYYISMQDGAGAWHLFLYHAKLRMWYRQDSTHAAAFAQVDDDLYYINGTSNELVSMYGKDGDMEGLVPWVATTGIIGYENKDHKYISRINIRTNIPADGFVSVYFRYDSVGDWILAGTIEGNGLVRSAMLPVRPRRCDHFQMRISGEGDVRIFSIAKILEIGSDGRWTST